MVILIELKNPDMPYIPGDVVDGRVLVRFGKPTTVKGVTISLEGIAEVEWKETELYTEHQTQTVNGKLQTVPVERSRTNYNTADETYVALRKFLVGDGYNCITLPEGTSAYPFHFTLPKNLPSSFTSQVGNVSYVMKAEIVGSLYKPSDKARLPIEVFAIFDLNLEPGVDSPQECKKLKEPNVFASRQGEINFVLRLPERCGYVPGEILDFQVEIQNESNQKVEATKTSLLQITKAYAEGKCHTANKIICTDQGPEVPRGISERWNSAKLKIPPVPPTKLGGGCKIIGVQYVLDFEMKISGLSSGLSGQLPVMIGTVPLNTRGNGTGLHENRDGYREPEANSFSNEHPPLQPGYRPEPQPGYRPEPTPRRNMAPDRPPPPVSAPQPDYTSNPPPNRMPGMPVSVLPQPEFMPTGPPPLNRMPSMSMPVPQPEYKPTPASTPGPIGFHLPVDNMAHMTMHMPMVPSYKPTNYPELYPENVGQPVAQPQPPYPGYSHLPPVPLAYAETVTYERERINWDTTAYNQHNQTNGYVPHYPHYEDHRRM